MVEAPKAIDYALSDKAAEELCGIVLFDHEFRLKLLRRYQKLYGEHALVNLFSQFIGLANSVVDNNREMIELLGITQGGDHPHAAEQYNLPTIFGALQGVSLANGLNQNKTCGGCAYRLGTPANQSPSTTCDADWCLHSGEPDFMCHERLDKTGEPKRLCAGYAQRTKSKRKLAAEERA